MSTMVNRLNIARASFVVSALVSLKSLGATLSHVGNEKFLLAGFPEVSEGLTNTHGWYHFLREGFGDIAALVILAMLFFGPKAFRTPQTWLIGIVACLGYYLPFWVGMPFNSALAAPSLGAELTHIGMALFAFGALFIAKPLFNDKLNSKSA